MLEQYFNAKAEMYNFLCLNKKYLSVFKHIKRSSFNVVSLLFANKVTKCDINLSPSKFNGG